MADLYTSAEITAIITEIDAVIATTRKLASYSIDDGQGKQATTRQSLADLYKEREYWIAKLDELDDTGLLVAEVYREY